MMRTNLPISNFVIRKSNVEAPMGLIVVCYSLKARMRNILRTCFTKDFISPMDFEKKFLNPSYASHTLYFS